MSGLPFGPGGEGFVRVNLGTSRAVLTEAVDRMVATLASTDLAGPDAGRER